MLNQRQTMDVVSSTHLWQPFTTIRFMVNNILITIALICHKC